LELAARCRVCGAPLEVTPETIVAVCSYCGAPNWTVQAYTYPIVIVPAQSSGARRIMLRWLENDPDLRRLRGPKTIKSLEIVYFPLYVVDAHARSRYAGVAAVTLTRTRVVKRGKETTVVTETRTVEVPVSGVLERDYTVPVVARRNYDRSIVDRVVEYYLRSRPEAVPIGEVDWSQVKGTVLAAEFDHETASRMALDEACDRLIAEVEKKMDEEARARAMALAPGWLPTTVVWLSRRRTCRPTVKQLSPLTLVPMISGSYAYRGSIYSVAFAGWDGAKVYSEEPVTAGERLAYFAGAVGAAGLLGGGGLAAGLALFESTLAGLLGLLAGAVGAYYLSQGALRDVRVEGVEEY